jgi:hypothetical protein
MVLCFALDFKIHPNKDRCSFHRFPNIDSDLGLVSRLNCGWLAGFTTMMTTGLAAMGLLCNAAIL